jgi:hypothetical protein
MKNMNARKEIEQLKREFVTLKSEDEKQKFDVKFCNHLASKSEDEKQVFAEAFIQSAKDATNKSKQVIEYVKGRMNQHSLATASF